ncbi:hypothetical protein E3N88_22888 [Mikania micrantha]|uniref:non-specific serine/threonine protein kinase n=1 Tax=Mikania micrantha TaxID=192012 RepID=A0A5N6NDF1_9ASTR|nr:hypothetical protein E3N88_22888 [Mikania micrantha]
MSFATGDGKKSEPSSSSSMQRSLDEEQWALVIWVQDSIKDENLKDIIDSDIRGEISPKCLKEYIKLAERCLHNSPRHRPTMAEVLFSLEAVMALQEKFNNSLQSASRTLFGRMVNLFPFPSNQENYVPGDIKLSTLKEVPAQFLIQSPILKEFKFSDLEKVTRSFSPDMILGEGCFGKVFLGWVKENTLAPSKQGVGMAVAVKRLNKENAQGAVEWQAEVNLLGHLAHPNIIRLLGYCRDELKHLLVYEYMPNKSFDRFLFSGDFVWANNGLKTWETSVTPMIVGTCGYIAPEYMATGHLTTKCDIYSFGVVLLGSISGRKVVDFERPEEERNLVYWATCVGSNIKKIMDPRLEGKYPLHGASEYVAVALSCVADNPKDRPSGEEVLQKVFNFKEVTVDSSVYVVFLWIVTPVSFLVDTLIESRISAFNSAVQLSSCLDLLYTKTVEDGIDEGEEPLEPIIFEDVSDDEDQSEEDGDAMETDVEDNEEHEAVSNVSDDDIEGSDGMVDY